MNHEPVHGLSLSVGAAVSSAFIKQELITILSREADALYYLINHLPQTAEQLVTCIMHTTGRVIFAGMGKSGLVARKLAATFSSLGTPSFFLHPGDALHGDLGMVQPQDLFIALSKSGTGPELEEIFRYLRNQNNHIALICCDQGVLANKADLTVVLPFTQEACYLNLAPSSSSTLMMAFGDALALVTSKLKNFTHHDFARFHPQGMLGKKLLLTVETLMHHERSLPFMSLETSFQDAILTITAQKLGVGIVVDTQQKLLGIITDGDLRRACNHGPQAFHKKAGEFMTKNPRTIAKSLRAREALVMMEEYNITSLVVVDQERVVGLIHIHDILKAGLKG